jgi:hypothetical protein
MTGPKKRNIHIPPSPPPSHSGPLYGLKSTTHAVNARLHTLEKVGLNDLLHRNNCEWKLEQERKKQLLYGTRYVLHRNGCVEMK